MARAAAEFPDRVGGVVIVSGSLDPDVEKLLTIQKLGAWPPAEALLPRPIRNSNRELLPLEHELRELQPALASIRCPAILIHGTRDGLVPYSNVEYMKRHFPAGTIVDTVTLPGGNHFVPWNSPQTVRDAVRRLGTRQVSP
ncbi:alpha/beta hydrolase [Candidatus Poribacteria bacterium]|nr:alpha/beta hydrolase [Candidatus Poribacteria bacterium]